MTCNNIVHVLHYVRNFFDATGGAQIFTRGLIHHLQKYGIDQSLITSSPSNKVETTTYDNVTIFSLPTIRVGYYNILTNLLRVLRKNKFDLINVHGYNDFFGDFVCMLTRLGRLNVPLVLTTLGPGSVKLGYQALDFSMPFTIKDRVRKLIVHYCYDLTLGRLSMNTFDKIIIHSEEEKNYFSRIGLKMQRSLKMPLAVNDVFFTHPERGSNRDYILYVGRIDPYKGLSTLLKGVKELRLAGVELPCIIVGKDYGYKTQLEFLIDKLQIGDLVEFRDFVAQENLIRIYSSALVTILLSDSEGFPACITESMTRGTPFIATRVGVTPELVEQTKSGILIQNNDPKMLASTIQGLLEDKPSWLEMSANGQAASKNFTWQKIAKSFYDLYLEVVK